MKKTLFCLFTVLILGASSAYAQEKLLKGFDGFNNCWIKINQINENQPSRYMVVNVNYSNQDFELSALDDYADKPTVDKNKLHGEIINRQPIYTDESVVYSPKEKQFSYFRTASPINATDAENSVSTKSDCRNLKAINN
ncbi:MAG: hypothetical protein NTY22_09665 [Proteobacteria bacterium]|nr:hypothetical protein [Pseudomonadota bacterium]